MLSDNFIRGRRWRRCFISAALSTHAFWHAKTRIWSFTPGVKGGAINAPWLWWPNWYTTCSRLFAHYPHTNKVNGPDTSTQQQHTLLQLSIKDGAFVLVIIITICRNHKCAKFINRKYSELLAKHKKRGTLRIMDLWIIMAALFLLYYIPPVFHADI